MKSVHGNKIIFRATDRSFTCSSGISSVLRMQNVNKLGSVLSSSKIQWKRGHEGYKMTFY